MRYAVIADYFADKLPGGSEKSLEAILDVGPVPIERINSHDFKLSTYTRDDVLIFGNFFNLPLALMPEIARNFRYVIIESDYKYCVERCPELHALRTGKCDCEHQVYGKRILEFYRGAQAIFWKSTKHRDIHFEKFPELKKKHNTILYCTYTDAELDYLWLLTQKKHLRFGYGVFKSDSWIKGYPQAVQYCKDNKLFRVDIKGADWEKVMVKLTKLKGVVFFPMGMESCSRVVVEAKILGCDVRTNDNAPVTAEDWYKNGTADSMLEFLRGKNRLFWDVVKQL